MTRLHGAIAAAVTPMRGEDLALDDVGPLTSYLVAGGMDGLLACGTTGEGVLLEVGERFAVVEAFLAARPPGFQVAVHAGAQTTHDTCALAAHARDARADAVAVIAPPYYPLDDVELGAHLAAAAAACAPLPFYVYAFAARSGYPVPPALVATLAADVPNLAGLKVSDTPLDAVRPYLELGLDVFIGSEPLVLPAFELGAVGTVSGLASAFPGIVARLVHDRDPAAHEAVRGLRDGLRGIPFQAALKEVLVGRGVLASADVRAPLRMLTDDERAALTALVPTSPAG